MVHLSTFVPDRGHVIDYRWVLYTDWCREKKFCYSVWIVINNHFRSFVLLTWHLCPF